MEESYPPVRIVFGEDGVLVEDGPAVGARAADQRLAARSGGLMVAPLCGGVPSPIDARGRAALGMFASRRVRIQGRIGLMRSFVSVIRI